MKEKKDYVKDIVEIRSLMERSSKFLSLAGWAASWLVFMHWRTSYYLWYLHALSVRKVKISIDGIYKAFESRIRLGIMATLAVNDMLDFNSLKNYLDVTDGNLASHIRALEQEAFLYVEKSFVGKKPKTKYFITKVGKQAFDDHLKALEQLINTQK